ncbi:MAG TPA: ABC transporter ATP-binding protein [Bacillota bacterium]|nr:ABC transporter ATP-binding protein [Bacillota bacterium]HRU40497.1 ABC transporter ATP-binding protein [Candidatus Diapherotrites archaeon]
MKTIQIKGVSKVYGYTKALDKVDITIESDRIYGLLGRNGAGKTTLLNLMTNRIFPTEGEILIDGETVFENDRVLGNIFYMTEKNLYPEDERVRNIYKWIKEFYPSFDVEYAKDLSERFGLDTKKRVKSLSTGYTSIFKAVAALASNADILLLDEPVLGLDANHRDMFYKELISNYSESPKTIIISTHLIEEVASVIEEAIIIKEGKLILKQSVEELLSGAYLVSGEASKVDKYIQGRKCIGIDAIGSFKSATVLEAVNNKDEALAEELELEFGKAELQKLFISLTN